MLSTYVGGIIICMWCAVVFIKIKQNKYFECVPGGITCIQSLGTPRFVDGYRCMGFSSSKLANTEKSNLANMDFINQSYNVIIQFLKQTEFMHSGTP